MQRRPSVSPEHCFSRCSSGPQNPFAQNVQTWLHVAASQGPVRCWSSGHDTCLHFLHVPRFNWDAPFKQASTGHVGCWTHVFPSPDGACSGGTFAMGTRRLHETREHSGVLTWFRPASPSWTRICWRAFETHALRSATATVEALLTRTLQLLDAVLLPGRCRGAVAVPVEAPACAARDVSGGAQCGGGGGGRRHLPSSWALRGVFTALSIGRGCVAGNVAT